MSSDVETIVIGGGVVGLAIARAMLLRGREVILMERHRRLGAETSSRNSEVVHAGLYYPNGSLRARLCVEGRDMLYRFAQENGVVVQRYGKLLVATSEAEVPLLRAIEASASCNGVMDLRRLDPNDVRAIEPEVFCVAACLSPSTGVIDSHGLIRALEGHVLALGGVVALDTVAHSVTRTADGLLAVEAVSVGECMKLTTRTVIVAAGHGASALGRPIAYDNGYLPPETYPAKGHYFALTGLAPFRHLIYPMPQGAWLGLHLTLDVAGRARFGPDIEWCDGVSYEFEDADGARRKKFETEIRRYWPGLPDGALQPDYAGVRPKIYRAGESAADFAIHDERQHGVAGLIALYGIESPGLTSCLAIGEHVACRLAGRG